MTPTESRRINALMCPYGLIYNIISALPWPALVGFLQPMLDSLAAKRRERKLAAKQQPQGKNS